MQRCAQLARLAVCSLFNSCNCVHGNPAGCSNRVLTLHAQTSATTAAGRATADVRAAAARALARGVYDALLPPLGGWLGAVAATKPKSSPVAAVPAAASAEAAVAAEADVEADVVLACRVVSAALLGAQTAGQLVTLQLCYIMVWRPALRQWCASNADRPRPTFWQDAGRS